MGKLTGKTALITGGTSGIGLASAQRFITEGARVAVTGIEDKFFNEARDKLGEDSLVIATDAGDIKQIPSLYEQINSNFGKLDILYLNAGIAPYNNLASITEEEFDKVYNLHVKGPLFTIQGFVPMMSKGSSILVTTSNTSRMGMLDTHIYASSKAALRQLVRTLCNELSDKGIRVNSICPGAVKTNIKPTGGYSEEQIQAAYEFVTNKIPLHRFAEPEEIASVALFLASDDASYINGEEILCDAGFIETNR